MPLTTVIEPAPRKLLTTADRVRAALGSTEDDERLEQRIRAASSLIEAHCGRTFARERVRVTYAATGLRVLAVTRTPIVEIHSLTVAGIERSHTLADPSAGLIHVGSGHEDMWLALGGPRLYDREPPLTPYVIEYTGGYIVPGWTEDLETGLAPDADLPAVIEDAVIETVRAMLDYGTAGSEVQTERLGDYAITYRDTSRGGRGIPEDVLATLAPYRAILL